jgi:hypothetical protein
MYRHDLYHKNFPLSNKRFSTNLGFLLSLNSSKHLLSNNDNNAEKDLKTINDYLIVLSPHFNFEDASGMPITYPGITF